MSDFGHRAYNEIAGDLDISDETIGNNGLFSRWDLVGQICILSEQDVLSFRKQTVLYLSVWD